MSLGYCYDQNMQMVQPPDLKQEPEDSDRGHRISGSEKLLTPPPQTFLHILVSVSVSVPSAVSSMLERLCPRLMPLTAGGRSTLDPLSWGVEVVTSGGTLFSGGGEDD